MKNQKSSRVWSNEETFEFIEIYQQESCIWNPKDKLHRDKNKVNDSWQKIANATGISVIDLKKKKETLMTAFRYNLKRKKNSMTSGAGEDEIFTPIWMFYDAMEMFLSDIYECKSIENSEKEIIHFEDGEEESSDNEIEKADLSRKRKLEVSHKVSPATVKAVMPVRKCRLSNPSEMQDVFISHKESPAAAKAIIPTIKRRSSNPPELQDVNATINDVPMSKENKDACDDECVLYGKLLAIKLKQFSPLDRNELMYEMDGLIMKKIKAMYYNSNTTHSSDPSHWCEVIHEIPATEFRKIPERYVATEDIQCKIANNH